MDEPTEQAPDKGRRPVIAARSRLSPLQEAWSDYVTHANRCPACRDIDQCCTAATTLYRAWRTLAEQAARIVAGE